ncbi:TetR family transcriptional regulator [Azospirillaceae bacterium]
MSVKEQPSVDSLLGPELEGRLDLADARIVGLLVRGFADRTLEMFQRVLADEASQDEAIEEVSRVADSLNTLFLGQALDGNVTVGPWNSPNRLGAFVQNLFGFEQPPEQCVRALLIFFATHLMRALQTNSSDWNRTVELLNHEMTDILLGRMPNQSP